MKAKWHISNIVLPSSMDCPPGQITQSFIPAFRLPWWITSCERLAIEVPVELLWCLPASLEQAAARSMRPVSPCDKRRANLYWAPCMSALCLRYAFLPFLAIILIHLHLHLHDFQTPQRTYFCIRGTSVVYDSVRFWRRGTADRFPAWGVIAARREVSVEGRVQHENIMAFTGNGLAHGQGFHAFNLFAALASLLSERFVGEVHACVAWAVLLIDDFDAVASVR